MLMNFHQFYVFFIIFEAKLGQTHCCGANVNVLGCLISTLHILPGNENSCGSHILHSHKCALVCAHDT